MSVHKKEPEEVLEAIPGAEYMREFPPRPARTRVRASRSHKALAELPLDEAELNEEA